MNWLISADEKIYKCEEAFEALELVDWGQSRKYEVGDYVYIYFVRPTKKIRFKCVVVKTNVEFEDIIDDREFWVKEEDYEKSKEGLHIRLKLIGQADTEDLSYEKLLEHGLKGAPRGPLKLEEDKLKLREYIESCFEADREETHFPEEIEADKDFYEGAGVKVTVNKYERNPEARRKCIEYNGCKCNICGINFEEVYGDIGKGFIHVHHITPISQITKEYKVDYKKDLIPVCPNCHAMLHRKVNGKCFSIEELKELFKNK